MSTRRRSYCGGGSFRHGPSGQQRRIPDGTLAASYRIAVGHYCVVAHAGVALRLVSPVDSGLLFATSFGRMVSAGRDAQRR